MNIDLLARKRQWEKEKRGTLISADASWLYQTSNKINTEIDKRIQNGAPVQRESLQSRLLERITTKKQVPQEIYLEEELSSDEEDDDEET